MRMPSSRVANRIQLFLLWNPLKSIVHLAQRTTLQIQHATCCSTLLFTGKRGMQKMQAWSEQKCPRWSLKKSTSLITFMLKEGAAKIVDLIELLFTTTMLSKCLVTYYLQRKELQMCQK
jgi:hypothetical protein